MQDQAPMNRAQRRAQSKPGRKSPALVRPFRPQSPNAARGQATGIGNPSSADEQDGSESDLAGTEALEDSPPAGRGAKTVSHHKGAGKLERMNETLIAYYALLGMGVSRLDKADGELIVNNAGAFSASWIAAAKANPQIMRALEVITVAGPYTALILLHVQVAAAIMDHHNASPLQLFQRVDQQTEAQRQAAYPTAPEPAPLPYQPVGPTAPTQAPVPPAYRGDEDGLTIWPDEGLPADLESQLRTISIQSGRPYAELRKELMVQVAQARMQQNGRVQSPGALGAPIAAE